MPPRNLKTTSEMLLHQIRNSGQVLSGSLEIMNQGGHKESKVLIQEEIQNLYRFINQMHASQMPSLHEITFHPAEIITNLVSAFSRQHRRFQFVSTISKTECLLKRSVFEFETLLILLLDNAVRYTPKGQKIEVHFEKMPETPASLTITNFGVSLDPNQKQEIFLRNKKQKNGMGLGLALAYHLAQKNQFQLGVETQKDTFVQFKILFPYN